jgi:hypothetical protein
MVGPVPGRGPQRVLLLAPSRVASPSHTTSFHKQEMMMKRVMGALSASVLCLALATAANADEAAEKYVDDALPYMYHSCESVVEESKGNTEYIDKVIRALLAVSLYNREIDISKYATTEEDKTALQQKFAAALGEQCKKDNDALLAGAIDTAVASTLQLAN